MRPSTRDGKHNVKLNYPSYAVWQQDWKQYFNRAVESNAILNQARLISIQNITAVYAVKQPNTFNNPEHTPQYAAAYSGSF